MGDGKKAGQKWPNIFGKKISTKISKTLFFDKIEKFFGTFIKLLRICLRFLSQKF